MSDRRLPLSTVLIATVLAIAIGGLAAGLIFGGGDDDDGDVATLSDDATQPSLGEAVADPVGNPVPSQSYETFDGDEKALSDYEGKPLVVNFFASWCVPCVQEMPGFEEVHRDLGDDVGFLGLDVRDSAREGQALVARTGVTYDVGRDPSGSLLAQFGGVAMPTTALVDESGTIVKVMSGETSADELRDAIAAELT